MSVEAYFLAQKTNLSQAVRFEPFAVLVSGLHRIYRASVNLIPMDHHFGRFVLMADQAFLAAASLIGQAQPDDAAPITRRAIEMIRVAAAVKEDQENHRKWLAFEDRHRRWRARQEGTRPESLRLNLHVQHAVVQQLMVQYGILSDAGAHFTPEYFATLKWQQRPGQLFLQYLTGDERTIERETLLLVGTHLQILSVLNDCLDGALGRDEAWTRKIAEFQGRARVYSARFRERYGISPTDESGNATTTD